MPPDWIRPVPPLRIIGNIYYVGSEDLASYLIVTPAGSILLDGGLPENAPLIERNVATLGFRVRDIKYLLNSHAHFDHAGGLAKLKRQSGAQMIASRADAELLEAGRQVFYSASKDQKMPPVKVDRVISDGGALSLGGVTLSAHLTPGHTKGCTTWTMPVQELGVTHHVVFFCSTTAPDYLLVNNPKYPQIAADYQRSFAKLRQLPCDVFLAPHASFFDLAGKRARMGPGRPNPFVDAHEFSEFLDGSERDFQNKLKEQQAAKR